MQKSPDAWQKPTQYCKPIILQFKRSVFNPIPKKGNAKECSNYHTVVLISHTSQVMLKILQVRLQQYMNGDFPDIQLIFKKEEEPEIKLPTSTGS